MTETPTDNEAIFLVPQGNAEPFSAIGTPGYRCVFSEPALKPAPAAGDPEAGGSRLTHGG